MALFQTAPRTDEDAAQSKPLEISPDKVLTMDEAEWYANVYRGDDVPQLTIRAVLYGSLLGFLLAFTNLYIGLKTGWHIGVAITACILAYALSSFLKKVGVERTTLTILETNCMQSTASAAGYSTGGTMVSAIPAMLMLSVTAANPGGTHMAWWVLGAWTLLVAALGCVMAIPMKRRMINQERLKFPSGTAAAVTLQSLYSHGAEAMRKAKALLYSALASAMVPILIDLNIGTTKTPKGDEVPGPLLPSSSPIFDKLIPARSVVDESGQVVGDKISQWTVVMDHSPLMVAAGMLVGVRVAGYMLVAGLALAFFLGPLGFEAEWISPATGELTRATTQPWKAWKEIGIWVGVPIMVTFALGSFVFQLADIARKLRGREGSDAAADNELARLTEKTEVPTAWFASGTVIAGAGIVWLAWQFFEVPPHYGFLAVFMTFFLALVACRVTGESDVTPSGPLGKIMQLTYGVLIPQSTSANLMTAAITAGAAGASADLLNDLKSGYLLGANPRRQFIAQFLGIFTGTVATVAGFYLLVPDATVLLGSEAKPIPDYPAPSAQAWKAVAEVFQAGLSNMHPMHREGMVWGGLIGLFLLLLEQFMPKQRKWLPSATGIGLGLILPFQYPLSIFLGAVIAFFWMQKHKKSADQYLIAIASGVIAGISIMGVIAAILNNFVL